MTKFKSLFSFAVLLCALFIAPLVQAQTATPVPMGAPVSLSVTADGTQPFTYQWLKNGTPIPAATNSVYAIAAYNFTFSGTYSVIVSNSAGSDTAPAVVIAMLTIKPSNSKIGVAVGLAPAAATVPKP